MIFITFWVVRKGVWTDGRDANQAVGDKKAGFVLVYPKIDDGGESLRKSIDSFGTSLHYEVPNLTMTPAESNLMDYQSLECIATPEVFSLPIPSDENGVSERFQDRISGASEKHYDARQALWSELIKLKEHEFRASKVFFGNINGGVWDVCVNLPGHLRPIAKARLKPGDGRSIGIPTPSFFECSLTVRDVPADVELRGMLRIVPSDGEGGAIWEPTMQDSAELKVLHASAWLLVGLRYEAHYFPGVQAIQTEEALVGYPVEGFTALNTAKGLTTRIASDVAVRVIIGEDKVSDNQSRK